MDNNPILLLSEKIKELDQWFDSIKEKVAEGSASIHDVIDYNGEEWVVWSDSKGYSVSHKAYGGRSQGCSGTYPTLYRCLKYIYRDAEDKVTARCAGIKKM